MRRPLGYIASAIQTGGSFVGLLDSYPGAGMAGGIRRLSSSYSGNLMRIIRESDSAVTDIGYDSNGDLDTATIASFCSGTNGYILFLYDQSGNGINIIGNGSGSALTNLPIIYTGGAVPTLNGLPAIQITHPRTFAWTDNSVNLSTFLTGGASGDDKRTTGYMVGQQSSATRPYKIIMEDNTTQNEALWFYENSGVERIDFDETGASMGAVFTDDTQKSWIWQVEGTRFEAYENGSSIGSSANASIESLTNTGVIFNIGGFAFSSRNMEGYIQELVVWPIAVSASLLYTDSDSYYSFA